MKTLIQRCIENDSERRSLVIHCRPTPTVAGRLTIVLGKQSSEYLFTSRPSGDGVCYELSNLAEPESRTYTVEITQHGNSCGCKGFAFRQTCRHVLALAQLTARDAASGQMPPEAPKCRVCDGSGFREFRTAGSAGVSRCVACDDGEF